MAVKNIKGNQSKQKDTDEKKSLLINQELKIARSLAGNEKVTRDRALNSLKKWFHRRRQNLAFTEEDFLRLWKGLYYSMWMSDKPLIQEECADNIASLLHELPLEHSLIFFNCGLETLCTEWLGINQLRLDKFLMFVRRLLRQALVILKKNGFKKEEIVEFGNILCKTVLNSEKKDMLGLFMHFTDIFLEELAKVSGGKLKSPIVIEFLIPFIKTLAICDDPRKIKQIKKSIFIHLMYQSDVGMEYQERYEAWKQLGFPGTIHGMKKIEVDEDGDLEEEDGDDTVKMKVLDPRAGRVDVEIPQIKFNAKVLADLLIKYKYSENSKVAARKVMTSLSKQLRKLSKGIYPLGVTDLRLPKQEDTNVRKAVNRLVKFEKKLMQNENKSKKRINEDDQTPVVKKVKSEPDDGKINIDNIPKNILRQGIDLVNQTEKAKAALPDFLRNEKGDLPVIIMEQDTGLWKVYEEPMVLESAPAKPVVPKKKSSKTKKQEIFAENPWDVPIKTTELKTVLPSKKYAQKLKKLTQNSSKNIKELINSNLVNFKNPSELLKNAQCSTPERVKRVKINTSLNMSQEFEDYHMQMLSSPGLTHDATKKPGKPLLKTRNTTPINPFSKKYKP